MALLTWILAPLVSALAVLALLIVVPASFLEHPHARGERLRRRIEGSFLVVLGTVIAPGVFAAGLVLIALGLTLLLVPGRERLERDLDRHRRTLGALNRLRARFHRPPMRLHHP